MRIVAPPPQVLLLQAWEQCTQQQCIADFLPPGGPHLQGGVFLRHWQRRRCSRLPEGPSLLDRPSRTARRHGHKWHGALSEGKGRPA